MSITTTKIADLEYLTAEGICVPHCFTTRLGGVSTGTLSSLNIAMHRGDAPENVVQNYRILGDALGFSPEQLVLTRQTHTDIVRPVTKADCRGLDHRDQPECDALITNEPGVGLVVFTADCTPILFHDPVTGAVGAAHAGWRGTAAGIAAKTVQAMTREFGCSPTDIRAAIGPNIGACCFQTDGEVPRALLETYGPDAEPFIQQKEGKFYPDLKKINALALQNAGVGRVELSSDCTMCQSHRFWSHRVHGDSRGSQGAIIYCKEARE